MKFKTLLSLSLALSSLGNAAPKNVDAARTEALNAALSLQRIFCKNQNLPYEYQAYKSGSIEILALRKKRELGIKIRELQRITSQSSSLRVQGLGGQAEDLAFNDDDRASLSQLIEDQRSLIKKYGSASNLFASVKQACELRKKMRNFIQPLRRANKDLTTNGILSKNYHLSKMDEKINIVYNIIEAAKGDKLSNPAELAHHERMLESIKKSYDGTLDERVKLENIEQNNDREILASFYKDSEDKSKLFDECRFKQDPYDNNYNSALWSMQGFVREEPDDLFEGESICKE